MSLPYKFTAEELISRGRTSRRNVEIIRNWLSTNTEQNVPRNLPDETICIFLLSCEDDVQFTQTTIITHYNLKKETPELHGNRNCAGENIQSFFKTWILTTLPERTNENYAIHYCRLVESDYRKLDVPTFLKASLMLVDITQEKNPPDGFITILDVGAAGLQHLLKVKFGILAKYLNFVQEGLPMKLQAVHILNSNILMSKVFNLVKSCIKGDVINKIYFHPPNMKPEEFYEHLPQKCLPKEFGGTLSSLKVLHEDTKRQFENKQAFWDSEEQIRKELH